MAFEMDLNCRLTGLLSSTNAVSKSFLAFDWGMKGEV
jgi:hypothetical protein